MNIEEQITEQKRKANLVNNLAIDFEHIKSMVPQVMYNNSQQVKPEFKELCKFLFDLCDRMENGVAELKTIIPTFNE